jgi:hypothetical protein
LIFLPFYYLVSSWYTKDLTRSHDRAIIRKAFSAGLPLGITGMVAGFLTGSSRSPAVSALVPAILTFIGLVIVYMIGKGHLRAAMSGFAVFLFTVQLLIGTVLGSASRDRREEALASAQVRESQADQEFKFRLYCKGLGLISDLTKPCPVAVSPEKQDQPKP